MISPAGFERYFEEMVLVEAGPPEPSALMAVAARYGLDVDRESIPVLRSRRATAPAGFRGSPRPNQSARNASRRPASSSSSRRTERDNAANGSGITRPFSTCQTPATNPSTRNV